MGDNSNVIPFSISTENDQQMKGEQGEMSINPYSSMTREQLGYEISAMKRRHYDLVQELKRLRALQFPSPSALENIKKYQKEATCLHDDIEEAEEEQDRKCGRVPKSQHAKWQNKR